MTSWLRRGNQRATQGEISNSSQWQSILIRCVRLTNGVGWHRLMVGRTGEEQKQWGRGRAHRIAIDRPLLSRGRIGISLEPWIGRCAGVSCVSHRNHAIPDDSPWRRSAAAGARVVDSQPISSSPRPILLIVVLAGVTAVGVSHSSERLAVASFHPPLAHQLHCHRSVCLQPSLRLRWRILGWPECQNAAGLDNRNGQGRSTRIRNSIQPDACNDTCDAADRTDQQMSGSDD